MHNSTEGLNPTLRAALGVGWNRALPGAFQFVNGATFDGVNDFVQLNFTAGTFPTKLTLEFWAYKGNSTNMDYFMVRSSTAGGSNSFYLRSGGANTNDSLIGFKNNVEGESLVMANVKTMPSGTGDGRRHIVVTVEYDGASTLVVKTYVNGGTLSGVGLQATGASITTFVPQANIDQFRFGSFGGGAAFSGDELRIYNGYILTPAEINAHYNAGKGGQPTRTENLYTWLQFEVAELGDTLFGVGLAPAWWGTGSTVYGIRDMSNNARHWRSQNTTQNSTLGGVITTFPI